MTWQLVIAMDRQEKIEILCATMGQHDCSKYYEMCISGCDVIYANQADHFAYEEMPGSGGRIKMLTTATVGVGKNRNLALALATGDLLLFADDDLRYEPGLAETLITAFHALPRADVIVFGLQYARNGRIFKRRLPETKRLSLFRALRYGTCTIAIRRETLLRHNLHFSELFGGGCLYSYGEDTDFLLQCFRKRLKLYSYRAVIATTDKDTSTCYTGYGEKFFFDKGALARHSLGALALPYMLRMARKKLDSSLSFSARMKYLWAGYQSFPQLISFERWMSDRAK